MIVKLTRHPLSALFAQFDLGDTEIAALSADIEANGQHVPIVMAEGQILDGWNRYRACFLKNIEPVTQDLPDDRDAWAYVCSVNMLRRSLTPKQKAAVFLLHEEMVNEGVQNCTPQASVREVAETFDISHGTAQNLTKVARSGTKELKDAVLSGDVSISSAAEIAKLPADEQSSAIVEDKRPGRKPAPVIVLDDALDDFDPIVELEQLQVRYDELLRTVTALQSSEGGAELAKQIAMTNSLKSRLDQEITKNAELDKNLRRNAKILTDLRKITEVDDDSKIAGVVKFMKAVPK